MTGSDQDRGRIKGAAFRGFLAWVEACGSADLRAVAKDLPPEDQRLLDPGRPVLGVLAATWYPGALVHRVLDRVTDGLDDRGLEATAAEAAEFTMSANLRGVYRGLVSLLVSPRIYAMSIQHIWNLHYGSGVVKMGGPEGYHRAVVTEWREHHPFICRLNAAAGHPIYRAMRCEQVATGLPECLGRGDPHCVYEVRWSAGKP